MRHHGDDSNIQTEEIPGVILLDQGHHRFNYRVAGVAIRDDAVLLHRATRDAFWTLPGGRAEIGEAAHDTLRREMREELDTDVHVDRLLWIVENFFDYQDRRHHELALYFLMHLPAQSATVADRTFERTLSDVPMVFEWVPLDALDGITIFPTFLRRALTALPSSVEHVVEGRSGASYPTKILDDEQKKEGIQIL
jgi:ADP-ribose pyrophosphatase YjhB (NUDIX family)